MRTYKSIKDLSEAEILLLKTKFETIDNQMAIGETRWCDHLENWERFLLNIDNTTALFASLAEYKGDDDYCKDTHPELFDLIVTHFEVVALELNSQKLFI